MSMTASRLKEEALVRHREIVENLSATLLGVQPLIAEAIEIEGMVTSDEAGTNLMAERIRAQEKAGLDVILKG